MEFNFSEWWDALQTIEKIYWGVAVPFTLLFIIQLILTFIGGGDFDTDGSVDVDIDTDAGIGFQFLTLKNLIAFFTIFGWVGLASLDSGASNGLSILISALSGILMMAIMAAIFYFLGKSQESGTLNMNNAVGAIGEVYMVIKKNRQNIGKIQVQVQGTLRTLDAITDDNKDLNQGTVVDVLKIANNNILIVTQSKS